jgi:hypothetical protein
MIRYFIFFNRTKLNFRPLQPSIRYIENDYKQFSHKQLVLVAAPVSTGAYF